MTPLQLASLAASTSLLAGWRLYLVTLPVCIAFPRRPSHPLETRGASHVSK